MPAGGSETFSESLTQLLVLQPHKQLNRNKRCPKTEIPRNLNNISVCVIGSFFIPKYVSSFCKNWFRRMTGMIMLLINLCFSCFLWSTMWLTALGFTNYSVQHVDYVACSMDQLKHKLASWFAFFYNSFQ